MVVNAEPNNPFTGSIYHDVLLIISFVLRYCTKVTQIPYTPAYQSRNVQDFMARELHVCPPSFHQSQQPGHGLCSEWYVTCRSTQSMMGKHHSDVFGSPSSRGRWGGSLCCTSVHNGKPMSANDLCTRWCMPLLHWLGLSLQVGLLQANQITEAIRILFMFYKTCSAGCLDHITYKSHH